VRASLPFVEFLVLIVPAASEAEKRCRPIASGTHKGAYEVLAWPLVHFDTLLDMCAMAEDEEASAMAHVTARALLVRLEKVEGHASWRRSTPSSCGPRRYAR
jgi:hypothetical protein